MNQTASTPSSPVRMRTTRSTSLTQILPSPILPVAADRAIVSTIGVDAGVVEHDLDHHLGDEVDLVLGAAVGLGVATLAAEAAYLADRHAGDAGRLEGVLHLVELERLDDCGDELHDGAPVVTRAGVLERVPVHHHLVSHAW